MTGLAVGGLLRTWLVKLSKTQLQRLYNPLVQSLADADGLTAYCRAQADARYAEERKRLATRHEEDLKRAKESHVQAIDIGETKRDERIRQINEIYAQRMVDVQTTQQREMREAVEAHRRRMAEIQDAIRAQPREARRAVQKPQGTGPHSLRDQVDARWPPAGATGWTRVSPSSPRCGATSTRYGPTWDDPSWPDRPLPRSSRRSSAWALSRSSSPRCPRGVSSDPRLMEGIAREFELPALRPFPAAANLLIETPAEGRAAALAVLQASMFRLLTSLPPGRSGSRSSIRSASAATSARSCTWPTSTRPSSPTRSGPILARSRSDWPTWQRTWRP